MKRARFATMCAVVALASNFPSAPATAQIEPYIGQLTYVGFNFCPRGWAQANGQILSIAQNTALFSLFGTTYGGNGQTTFALPDLRSRVPIHTGQGPGLSNYSQGDAAGVESVTLTQNELPAHSHTATVNVSSADAHTRSPVNANFANAAGNVYDTTTAPSGNAMNPGTVVLGASGGSQPHTNIQPYLVSNWCVALQGVFPPRN